MKLHEAKCFKGIYWDDHIVTRLCLTSSDLLSFSFLFQWPASIFLPKKATKKKDLGRQSFYFLDLFVHMGLNEIAPKKCSKAADESWRRPESLLPTFPGATQPLIFHIWCPSSTKHKGGFIFLYIGLVVTHPLGGSFEHRDVRQNENQLLRSLKSSGVWNNDSSDEKWLSVVCPSHKESSLYINEHRWAVFVYCG